MPLRAPKPASPGPLEAAFQEACAFAPVQAHSLARTPAELRALAQEEASFGRIGIDTEGFSAGMRLHVLQPARALVSAWRGARGPFDIALEPYRADIDAVRGLDGRLLQLAQKCQDEVAQAEALALADRRWVAARDAAQHAQARFDERRLAHGNRDATLWAYHPAYWLALACIGVMEWLINYDTFFLFTGVPAIAAGATLILGVLLAFAAHGHGTVWKQWSYRFDSARERSERHGSWRLLALSTLALAVVIAAAGGSRYAAAMHAQAGGGMANILGAEAVVASDPSRDVALSLLANVGAWLVGCFLAYFAHDADPDYMSATRQFARRSRAFRRAARPHDDRIRTIRARFARETGETEVAAATRLARVRPQADLLAQLEAHEEAVLRAIASIATANAETYRDALAAQALADRTLRITRSTGGARSAGGVGSADGADGGQEVLTPYDLRALAVAVTPAGLRGLA